MSTTTQQTKTLQTNSNTQQALHDAQQACASMGYVYGARLRIKMRDQWPERIYAIEKQVHCDAYRVRCMHTNRVLTFVPSQHPHQLVDNFVRPSCPRFLCESDGELGEVAQCAACNPDYLLYTLPHQDDVSELMGKADNVGRFVTYITLEESKEHPDSNRIRSLVRQLLEAAAELKVSS